MYEDRLIGKQLANFRVESLIARGGMGQVYYGWDVKLLRPVAIKVIDNRLRSDEDYVQRFISEARVAATWRHENIIQVYYAGEEQDLDYFVMEYIAGKSLGEVIVECNRTGNLLPYHEVIRIGRSVARALDYAHKQGVIHRDVKPQNVLIAKDGRVVLTDFGLALQVDKGSRGEVFGTAHYIAPEQARRSAEAVPQSDFYALGVMLFEMLTGSVPFDDPSPTSVALQHLTQEPPLPSSINPALSKEVDGVLLRALHKMPDQRYTNGRELIEALEKALALSSTPSRVQATELLSPAESSTASSPPFNPILDDPMVGRTLDEFQIEAVIGQGGMGRVYRAFDTRLKRPVAIKIIDPACRIKPDYFTRFEREARAIEGLSHLNIIQLYHYRESDGVLYMAMQYVEGVDLATLLEEHRKRNTFMNPQDVLHILSQICAGLDHMHTHGVIHRDLKPANILITREGNVVITDFGLALLAGIETQGKVFGSACYMAPEQVISSANAVAQSDLFSAGVILYEMFTGTTPFAADEPLEAAMQRLSEPPRRPSEIRAQITPEVEGVILKAIAKEAQDRYPDGAHFIHALAKAVQRMGASGQGAPAMNGSVAERLSQLHIPQNRLMQLLLLSIPILFILGVFYLARNNRSPAVAVSSTAASPAVFSTGETSSAASTLQDPGSTTMTLGSTPASPLTTPMFTASPIGGSATTPTNTLAPPTSTPPPTATATVSPTPIIRTIRTEDQAPMILVPDTTFMMGAANNDPNAEFDERPQHAVTLAGFYIDQYEVSVSQYANFLNVLKKHTGDACLSSTCTMSRVETPESHLLWNGISTYQAEAGFENHPINAVTWYGAQAYCEWVDARLPTEAEWELAARGLDGRLYPWGNQAPDATRAVFGGLDFAALLPVNSLPGGASFYGVYNMAGSVIEWIADTFLENYYATLVEPVINPLGPPSRYRTPRVLRGGSWKDNEENLRSSARRGAEPLLFRIFGSDTGFRCVRPVK